MPKVVFIGASIPNLYGANILNSKGFETIIYEREPELTNSQQRLIPQETLDKLGLKLPKGYYVLRDIKTKISDGLNIRFGVSITDFKKLEHDFLIINTKFKEIVADDKKVFLLNYNLKKDLDNHFAGNSLLQALLKIDEIVRTIIQTQI